MEAFSRAIDGGLDIAVESFFHARTVWHAEWEDAPSKVLAHHWPGVPNFRDVTQVDWSAVEPVDIITGGFPCQDVSMAGKRAGMTEGTRSNLWGAMRTAVEIIRPKYVVAENVRGLLSATADSDLESCPGCVGETEHREHTMRALGRVLGDLADLGYDAKWYGLRAADIGAPHNRFRVFILATDTDGSRRDERKHKQPGISEVEGPDGAITERRPDARGSELRREGKDEITSHPEHDGQSAGPVGGSDGAATTSGRGAGCVTPNDDGQSSGGYFADCRSGHLQEAETIADADSDGRRRGRPLTHQPRHPSSQNTQRHDASSTRTPQQTNTSTAWGDYQPAIKRWERAMGRPAPKPTQPTRSDGKHQLSPVFVEWMMGLNEGHVTGIDGISRANQLKMLGNGVVPQQAYEALRRMKEAA